MYTYRYIYIYIRCPVWATLKNTMHQYGPFEMESGLQRAVLECRARLEERSVHEHRSSKTLARHNPAISRI